MNTETPYGTRGAGSNSLDGQYPSQSLTQKQLNTMKTAMRLDYHGSVEKRLVPLLRSRYFVLTELRLIHTRLGVQDTPSAGCVVLKHQILTLDDVVGNPSDLQIMLNGLSDSELEFLTAFYQCTTEKGTTENMRVGLRLRARQGVNPANIATHYVESIHESLRNLKVESCVDNRVQLSVLAYAAGGRVEHD